MLFVCVAGNLPDGTYDRNTKIFFCCRNDGSASDPIQLPNNTPFHLVKWGDACQSVSAYSCLLHQHQLRVTVCRVTAVTSTTPSKPHLATSIISSCYYSYNMSSVLFLMSPCPLKMPQAPLTCIFLFLSFLFW